MMESHSFSTQIAQCRSNQKPAMRLSRRPVVLLALAVMGFSLVAAERAQCQVIVQGVFHSNSGDQLLNPNNQANFAATITPLINSCPTNSGFSGTNCSWPITATETNQWPDPDFAFSVEPPYNTSAYNVTWSMVTRWTDPCAAKNCAPGIVSSDTVSFSATLPGDQSWSPFLSPSLPANNQFGGSVAVQAQVKSANSCTNAVTGKLTFQVLGANPDPQAQVSFAAAEWNSGILGGAGWFLPNLIGQESKGLQFSVNTGRPTFGAPDGNGIMQVDRKVIPQCYAKNDQNPYWDFSLNIADGMDTLARKQQNSGVGCSTNLQEVTNSGCEAYAYDFWDRQVYQACVDSGGSTTPARNGGLGTETCNVPLIRLPQYPAGSPTLTFCSFALSYSDQTPSRHFQDLDWMQLYNGAPCGYFLSWDRTSRNWIFKTGSCTVGANTFRNYIVDVCQHAPAYN